MARLLPEPAWPTSATATPPARKSASTSNGRLRARIYELEQNVEKLRHRLNSITRNSVALLLPERDRL